jgi:hypothetical protein
MRKSKIPRLARKRRVAAATTIQMNHARGIGGPRPGTVRRVSFRRRTVARAAAMVSALAIASAGARAQPGAASDAGPAPDASPAPTKRGAARDDAQVDFGDEPAAIEVRAVPDPRPREHTSLLPDRFGRPPAPDAGDGGTQSPWPWIAIGGGIGLGATGAILHVADHPGAAIGCYGAAAAAIGVGIVLAVRTRRSAPAAAATPVAGGAMLWLGWSWGE